MTHDQWTECKYTLENIPWPLEKRETASKQTHLIRHIVNHYDAVSSSVVAGRDGAEPLLTGCVPLRKQSTARRSKPTQTWSGVYLLQVYLQLDYTTFSLQSEVLWSCRPARWSWSWSPHRWCLCSSLCTCHPRIEHTHTHTGLGCDTWRVNLPPRRWWGKT